MTRLGLQIRWCLHNFNSIRSILLNSLALVMVWTSVHPGYQTNKFRWLVVVDSKHFIPRLSVMLLGDVQMVVQ